MKMMCKKIIALLLGISIAISVCSCSCGEQPSPAPTTTAQATTQQTTTQPVKPENIGNMSFSNAFYKPKLGAVVYNVTLSDTEQDYRILAARCLQGLVARVDSSQIYLTQGENDLFWLNRLKDEYGIIVKELSFFQLFEKFAPQVKSLVTYNPDNKYETALAVYTASTKNAIPVPVSATAEFMVALSNIPSEPCTAVKDINCAGIADEQLKTAKGSYVALLNEKSAFIDYAYAVQAPVVYIDSKNSADTAALKKLLGSDKLDRPAVLFCENEALTDTASENGFGVLNVKGFSNVSYLSAFNCTNAGANSVEGVVRYSDEVDKYMSIEIVGDENEGINSHLSFLFKNSRRGSTPVTVAINPAVYELAPPIATWYAAGRRAATTISADSTGYMKVNADKMKENYFKTYCERSKVFLDGLGLSVLKCNFSEKAIENTSKLLERTNIMSDNGKITVINVDSIYNFNNYQLPESKSPFYCIRIKASDISTSTFGQLEDLVLKFQDKNDGLEFVLCEDMFATLNYLEKEAATTTTATTAATTKKQ